MLNTWFIFKEIAVKAAGKDWQWEDLPSIVRWAKVAFVNDLGTVAMLTWFLYAVALVSVPLFSWLVITKLLHEEDDSLDCDT